MTLKRKVLFIKPTIGLQLLSLLNPIYDEIRTHTTSATKRKEWNTVNCVLCCSQNIMRNFFTSSDVLHLNTVLGI